MRATSNCGQHSAGSRSATSDCCYWSSRLTPVFMRTRLSSWTCRLVRSDLLAREHLQNSERCSLTADIRSIIDLGLDVTEQGENGEDSPIVVGVGWQVQLGEDRCNVAFNGLGAEVETAADAGIRVAFGHKSKHLELTLSEAVQDGPDPLVRQQARDDLRVDDTFAGGDTRQCVREDVDAG